MLPLGAPYRVTSTPASTGTLYYHADGLGSLVATSNAAGQITASARYDAFGQTIGKTGSIPRYGYTGREPDKSGLIYYRARSYDPGLGRFAQRDPAGFADGINPYAYVGNNPVSFSDPLGLSKMAPSPVSVSAFAGIGRFNSIVNEFRTTAGAFKDAVVAKPALQAFAGGSTLGAGAGIVSTYPAAAVVAAMFGRTMELQDAGDGMPSSVTKSVPNPGGRLGSQSTRIHIDSVATEMEKRGWTITGGGNRFPEEYLSGAGGGRICSSFPDITAIKDGRTLRINTIDTRADGVTPTTREATNAARIRSQTPGDHLLLIPKP
jgi:RHS repeat-associated protein